MYEGKIGELTHFSPLVARWFAAKYGRPTAVQAAAWRALRDGEHALVCAPTGTGKTLAAFLLAIDRFVSGEWRSGAAGVLYVSPLRALNNDIRRNLEEPLAELAALAAAEPALGRMPALRVMVRSGDSNQSERRRLLREPPDILITTPESLNLLLLSEQAARLFGCLRWVILDEIHALLPNKRGTWTFSAVERLVRLAGEFRRVGLSATLADPAEAAAALGGLALPGPRPRPVRVIADPDAKRYSLRIRAASSLPRGEGEQVWQPLARELKLLVKARRSTLIFVNSRRQAERLALLLNDGEDELLAYSHHGSLSRELRLSVEEKLKRGELKALVATASLELGIDIGELDLVVLVESPMSAASAVQRLGRAGHRVGETSQGLLFAAHGRDLLNAAVLTRLVEEHRVEAQRVPRAPLDVLAQLLLAMLAVEEWSEDELYSALRCMYPYRGLARRDFESVLELLAGRWAGSRIPELTRRAARDPSTGRISPVGNLKFLLRSSGGVIPERGVFSLRIAGTRELVGSLDEEFVWERRLGDTFNLGTRTWRISSLDSSAVEVVPTNAPASVNVFWKGELQPSSFLVADAVGDFLDRRPDCPALDGRAAAELAAFLDRQRLASRGELPGRGRLVVELTSGYQKTAGVPMAVLHSCWGGAVNLPFGLALKSRLAAGGAAVEVQADNDGLLLVLEPGRELDLPTAIREAAGADWRELVTSSLVESGYFGARFRECAGRALLLPRSGFDRRVPLWLLRIKAKKLLAAIARWPDFPLVRETIRSCLEDEFDLDRLDEVMAGIRSGGIVISQVKTEAPSPFAEGLVWKMVNTAMYADDAPPPAALSGRVLLPADAELPPAEVEAFRRRLQRSEAAFAPLPGELADWLERRLLVPEAEWRELIEAAGQAALAEGAAPSAPPALELRLPGAEESCRAAPAAAALLGKLLGWKPEAPADTEAAKLLELHGKKLLELEPPALEDLFLAWLGCFPALDEARLAGIWGEAWARIEPGLAQLESEGRLIRGRLGWSESDAYERLLRFARARRNLHFEALEPARFAAFLAAWQGVEGGASRAETPAKDRLAAVIDRLLGWPAEAGDWESAILPARLADYRPEQLDELLRTTGLVWQGCGKRQLRFRPAEDEGLFDQAEPDRARESDEPDPPASALDPRAAYDFWDLHERLGGSSADAAEKLWGLVWQGGLTCDSFEPLRRGAAIGFKPERPESAGRPDGRRGFRGWAASRPLAGRWRRLARAGGNGDELDRLERSKERARLLLDRYGIVFRELLKNEAPGFQWKDVFPALRLMDLAGELVAGLFVMGAAGAQFALPEALAEAARSGRPEPLFAISARDPASLAGVGLPGLPEGLPRRAAGTVMVWSGKRLLLVSSRGGRELAILPEAAQAELPAALEALRRLELERGHRPKPCLRIERINGEAAPRSAHAAALKALGFMDDGRSLTVWPGRR